MTDPSPDPRHPDSIRRLFAAIAPSYDLLNRVLSLRRDRAWRNRLAGLVAASRPGAVLDLCCGTGDMAEALASRLPAPPRITCVDFCPEMVSQARKRWQSREIPLRQRIRADFIVAAARATGLPDRAFDCVTLTFSLRNIHPLEELFPEVQRLLRPGGGFYALELSRPASRILSRPYRWYLSRVLPRVGGWLSGEREAYRYLSRSILDFPPPPQIVARMTKSGFLQVSCQSWTLGVVTLYQGTAPGP